MGWMDDFMADLSRELGDRALQHSAREAAATARGRTLGFDPQAIGGRDPLDARVGSGDAGGWPELRGQHLQGKGAIYDRFGGALEALAPDTRNWSFPADLRRASPQVQRAYAEREAQLLEHGQGTREQTERQRWDNQRRRRDDAERRNDAAAKAAVFDEILAEVLYGRKR